MWPQAFVACLDLDLDLDLDIVRDLDLVKTIGYVFFDTNVLSVLIV